MEEILVAMVTLKQSYSDIMLMPTVERRFFLTRMSDATQENEEAIEAKRKKQPKNLGNGRRSTTI